MSQTIIRVLRACEHDEISMVESRFEGAMKLVMQIRTHRSTIPNVPFQGWVCRLAIKMMSYQRRMGIAGDDAAGPVNAQHGKAK